MIATIETGKEILSKSNAKLLAAVRWEGAKGTRTGAPFIDTTASLFFVFALHVEKAIVSFYFRACSRCFFILLLIFDEFGKAVVRL